jgi:hypothetical protein
VIVCTPPLVIDGVWHAGVTAMPRCKMSVDRAGAA